MLFRSPDSTAISDCPGTAGGKTRVTLCMARTSGIKDIRTDGNEHPGTGFCGWCQVYQFGQRIGKPPPLRPTQAHTDHLFPPTGIPDRRRLTVRKTRPPTESYGPLVADLPLFCHISRATLALALVGILRFWRDRHSFKVLKDGLKCREVYEIGRAHV